MNDKGRGIGKGKKRRKSGQRKEGRQEKGKGRKEEKVAVEEKG